MTGFGPGGDRLGWKKVIFRLYTRSSKFDGERPSGRAHDAGEGGDAGHSDAENRGGQIVY